MILIDWLLNQWTVKYAVELFDGTIVLEEEEQRKRQLEQKKKGKKKRWRSYFRRY
jgi:hypothetical protein